MKISELAPNPKNPRTITDEKLEQLKKAVREFGDLSGITYNRRTHRLVGGHQRSRVLDQASQIVITHKYPKPSKTGTVAEGHVLSPTRERFAYREVDWDETREKAANLAANKGAGEWDLPQLGEWLKEIGSFDADFDLDLTMFDSDELKEFGGITVSEHTRTGATGVDEDEVPERAPARAKLGDIYQLGRHRLMCGDSTDAKTVERLMKGEKADMWLTDAPYGVDYVAKNAAVNGGIVKNAKGNQITNDARTPEELHPFWFEVAANVLNFTTDKAASYWFGCSSAMMMMMMMTALDKAGWNNRHTLIWCKSSMVFGRSDYHYQHEPIIYGWKKDGTHEWFGDRKQTSVFNIDRPHRSDMHPTTKPIELLEPFINNSTAPGHSILDTFGGSGSTLIACEKTDRRCFMMEIDPHYVDVIIERWEKYTGQVAKQVRSATPKLKKVAQQPIDSHA